ncbi:MAG: oleate hydratase [Fusicatenibacter sp.]
MGTFTGKPMTQCTGKEILKEFLFQCGLTDKFSEIIPHCICIPVMMPYITSQFIFCSIHSL